MKSALLIQLLYRDCFTRIDELSLNNKTAVLACYNAVATHPLQCHQSVLKTAETVVLRDGRVTIVDQLQYVALDRIESSLLLHRLQDQPLVTGQLRWVVYSASQPVTGESDLYWRIAVVTKDTASDNFRLSSLGASEQTYAHSVALIGPVIEEPVL